LSLTAVSASAEIPGRYVLAMVRDATARVRLAEERAQLLAAAQTYAAQLEELARLRADFAVMIAHEFVAPLDAISLFADLFARGAIPAEQQATMASSIGEEVQLLQRLAQDTAAAARAERDDFAVVLVPVPAMALIDDAAEFAATLSDNHPVTVTADAEATVLADPARIGLVLRNLVENAVRHTPAGTPITVRAVRRATGVCIEVADEGPGLHADELHRIFEKFGRGRSAAGRGVPGVGLGLYLARRIIRAHGSELIVRTEPGGGSTFMFDLRTPS
ncbi:MAG: HAMP domain-containing histidine kinase, partial [Chloroflexota bacterium]|nr:HAMP domain-containing histidine kinase [Chloroflexota bacterium]